MIDPYAIEIREDVQPVFAAWANINEVSYFNTQVEQRPYGALLVTKRGSTGGGLLLSQGTWTWRSEFVN